VGAGGAAVVEAEEAAPPLVTITTAFYNTGEVFRETARCVFAQSLQAWEWVIVNDGSTDAASLALLDEFRRCDARVRVVDHPQNRGLSAARNTGFREARTAYVYQLDSDDLIEPTAVEKCLWYMHTHPGSAFVGTRVVGFGAQEYMWDKGFHMGETFLEENLATPMGIIRRSVFDEVGEYDEGNRGGMEDWEFWLRCAAHGHWGETIPEYLAWYRRREQHWDSWANMRAEEKRREFHDALRERYEPLLRGRFPRVAWRGQGAFEDVRIEPGLANPLAKGAPRLVLVVPWLTLGGADKFNVAMVRELVERGWEVTVVTTLAGDNSWLPEFTALTPDVFVTPHFLHPTDVPAFIRYLIESRSPDAVMVSNSEMGYHLLAYLRAYCPEPAYVDLSHMEEPWWKNGGHPRYGAGSQALLDLNIVVSEHLKAWQVSRGADPSSIEVCYVSACESSGVWTRDMTARRAIRAELGIGDDRALILYAGRIVEQKRPRVFAQTIRELAAARDDFECVVAGDGPDMGWLRHFVHEHGLAARVHLVGAVPHARMPGLMSASDVFFLPSMWEGIAISIYEAMSMGLAVVGADVGGQRELVTPECGVLVPRMADEADEVRAYVAALSRVLDDPSHGGAMGVRGRARIQAGFEPAHMGERIVELLAEACRRHEERPRAPIAASFGVECAVRGLEYLRAWEASEVRGQECGRLARELGEVRRERDRLAQERDELSQERDSMLLDLYAAGHNGHHAFVPDPRSMAQQMIHENMRYRVVDRLNDALKSVGLQGTLKALTVRVLRRRGSGARH
jgi:glycosyltransferase involved in cell wall biosynthesis